jgi:hypothetical protein
LRSLFRSAPRLCTRATRRRLRRGLPRALLQAVCGRRQMAVAALSLESCAPHPCMCGGRCVALPTALCAWRGAPENFNAVAPSNVRSSGVVHGQAFALPAIQQLRRVCFFTTELGDAMVDASATMDADACRVLCAAAAHA